MLFSFKKSKYGGMIRILVEAANKEEAEKFIRDELGVYESLYLVDEVI